MTQNGDQHMRKEAASSSCDAENLAVISPLGPTQPTHMQAEVSHGAWHQERGPREDLSMSLKEEGEVASLMRGFDGRHIK